eukprot:1159721-Pelagomonas_calceolata.AAC.9
MYANKLVTTRRAIENKSTSRSQDPPTTAYRLQSLTTKVHRPLQNARRHRHRQNEGQNAWLLSYRLVFKDNDSHSLNCNSKAGRHGRVVKLAPASSLKSGASGLQQNCLLYRTPQIRTQALEPKTTYMLSAWDPGCRASLSHHGREQEIKITASLLGHSKHLHEHSHTLFAQHRFPAHRFPAIRTDSTTDTLLVSAPRRHAHTGAHLACFMRTWWCPNKDSTT